MSAPWKEGRVVRREREKSKANIIKHSDVLNTL